MFTCSNLSYRNCRPSSAKCVEPHLFCLSAENLLALAGQRVPVHRPGRRFSSPPTCHFCSLGASFSFFGAKPQTTKMNPTRGRITAIQKLPPVSSVNKPQTNRLAPRTPPPRLVRVNCSEHPFNSGHFECKSFPIDSGEEASYA